MIVTYKDHTIEVEMSSCIGYSYAVVKDGSLCICKPGFPEAAIAITDAKKWIDEKASV